MKGLSREHQRLAQYGGRTLDFVVDTLGKKWFEMENGSPSWEQTSLIIHELGHEGEVDHLPHTGAYVHRIADLGARATHLAMKGVWWNASGGCSKGILDESVWAFKNTPLSSD